MFTLGARAAQDDESALHALGDFTANARLLLLSLVAIPIGILSAYVAVGLLSLINFFTNLFFFHRFSIAAASPAAHTPGAFVVAVPVVGGLIIGLMARYGSERIRGHGIPEAIESILINGSRVEPKLAVLKPLSSAISIGSGGPFGAEGPIIMTGGAFGSLVAQFLHLSSAGARRCSSQAPRPACRRPSRHRSRRCCSRSNCCSSSGSRAASSRSRWRASPPPLQGVT
jgi:CIC family chloride channel protein